MQIIIHVKICLFTDQTRNGNLSGFSLLKFINFFPSTQSTVHTDLALYVYMNA